MSEFIKTQYLCRMFPELPRVPEGILSGDFTCNRDTRQKLITFYGNSGYSQGTSADSFSWYVNDDIESWVNNNIEDTENTLIYKEVRASLDKPFYKPHVDRVRKFPMIYNMSSDGGELVFWQEYGHDLYRHKEDVKSNVDYSSLVEVARFSIPANTWYILNSQVIHSVENMSSSRNALQFSCGLNSEYVTRGLVINHD